MLPCRLLLPRPSLLGGGFLRPARQLLRHRRVLRQFPIMAGRRRALYAALDPVVVEPVHDGRVCHPIHVPVWSWCHKLSLSAHRSWIVVPTTLQSGVGQSQETILRYPTRIYLTVFPVTRLAFLICDNFMTIFWE